MVFYLTTTTDVLTFMRNYTFFKIKLLFQDVDIKSRRSRLSDYLWAKSVVGSRALSMSGKKYLVPLADMFNYQPHASEREANNGANFLKYHQISKDGFFHVHADRTATRNEQVRVVFFSSSSLSLFHMDVCTLVLSSCGVSSY